MKKLVLALTALAAFSGSATAADLGARRPYAKAAPLATPVTSWTGCYVGGGGGGAMTKNDHNDFVTGAPNAVLSPNVSTGADGWFGTVQVGCDYQLNNFVVGAFGDYDFMDVKGDISTGGFAFPVYHRSAEAGFAMGGGWPRRLSGAAPVADICLWRLYPGALEVDGVVRVQLGSLPCLEPPRVAGSLARATSTP